MSCSIMRSADRRSVIYACGEGARHEPCKDCGIHAEYLCDYPVGGGKTCDAKMCEAHAYKIAENTHYCKKHYKKWEKTSMSPRAKTCGQCTDFRACAQKAPAGKAGEWFEWAACPDFIEKDNGKVKAIKIDRYDRLQNRLIKEARNGKSSG